MNPKIKQLLETCKAVAPSCVFKIYDSEAHVITTADISAALAAMDGGDDVAEITVKDGKNILGCFACMPYGDEDEAVYDCADNVFCNTVCERMEAAENLKNN